MLIVFSDKQNYRDIILGSFLIFFGALIRLEVLFMCSLLAAPFVVIDLLKKNYKKIIFYTISVLFIFSAWYYDTIYYQNYPEFQAYKTFNKLRSRVTTSDSPSVTYERKKDIIEKIGWTKEDFLLVSNFNVDIGYQKFSIANLQQIAGKDMSVWERTTKTELLSNIKELIIIPIKFAFGNVYYLLFYAFLIFLFRGRQWKHLIPLSCYYLYTQSIIFLLYFYMDGYPKSRVLFGMFLPFYLLIIFLLSYEDIMKLKIVKFFKNHIFKYGLIAIAVLTSFLPILTYLRGLRVTNTRIESNQKIAAFIDSQNEGLYVNWLDMVNYDIFKPPYDAGNAYFLGWLASSPFNKDKIEKYTGERELGIYNIYNKNIVWYFRNNYFYYTLEFNKIVENFYLTNYQNVQHKMEIFPISERDTIFKYTYFIPLVN